jgi:hypothetical protein
MTDLEDPRIDPAAAKALVDAGRAVFLDTDPPGVPDPAAEAVAGAVRAPPAEFARRHLELPPACAVVAYCT